MNITRLRIPTWRRQTSWLSTSAAEKLSSELPRTTSASGQNGIWTRDLRISNPTLLPLGHAAAARNISIEENIIIRLTFNPLSGFKKSCPVFNNLTWHEPAIKSENQHFNFKKTCYLDELQLEPVTWSRDTDQWILCFDKCQLTIMWMSNRARLTTARKASQTTNEQKFSAILHKKTSNSRFII